MSATILTADLTGPMILNSDFTGPLLLDGGGVWRLTESSSVTSPELFNLFVYAEENVPLDLRILGDIEGTGRGLSVGGFTEITESVKVRIGEEANVSADQAADFRGISDLTFTNAGAILGESLALYVSDVDNAVIRNKGLIQGKQVGFEATSRSTAEDSLTFVNSGQILSEPDGGAAFWGNDYDQMTVRNSGTISGGGGLRFFFCEDVEIHNSGKIEGAKFQGVHFSSATGVNTLVNSGEIKGVGTAIHTEASQVILRNSGVIDGDVSLALADDRVNNTGKIIGDVDLGAGADTYRGKQQGHVTGKVLGGDGEDMLAGGELNDRLDGGSDDDLVAGRGGDDWLWGGAGADTLHGGAGDDHLIGGAGDDLLSGGSGRDTFVFGANSGHDRIVGFEKGQDSIQIFGHTGGYGTLTFETMGARLKVIHDGGEILLMGQAGQPLDASDFLFA